MNKKERQQIIYDFKSIREDIEEILKVLKYFYEKNKYNNSL